MATPAAIIHPLQLDVQSAEKRLWDSLYTSQSNKALDARLAYPSSPGDPLFALVSLGDQWHGKGSNAERELLRKATATGVKMFKSIASSSGLESIQVDGTLDAHACAVGSHLAKHTFSMKTDSSNVGEVIYLKPTDNTDKEAWTRGVIYAQAQILARELKETPANILTPTTFCELITTQFKGFDNVEIIVRDADWAAKKNMNAFLSVTHGSAQPGKLLEIHYKGSPSATDPPIALVGKGICFDAGGISIKPADGMKTMRADMGGASAVCSSAWAIAALKLPINLVVVTPLTENLPGPGASKPGDIVVSMSGKTIEIDNTDMEGRLVLAEALYYVSTEFKPHTMIDVATLTYASIWSLGRVFSAVFSSSDDLWSELHEAGEYEFDRFWRMPLDDEFGHQIYRSNADLTNNPGIPGGSCTAALFLRSFVPGLQSNEAPIRWAHIDMASTMVSDKETPYQVMGAMTGRPTRALIEFVRRYAVAQRN